MSTFNISIIHTSASIDQSNAIAFFFIASAALLLSLSALLYLLLGSL